MSGATIVATERHHDHTQQEYVSYVVDCVGEGEPWKIAKRFSDFSVLKERLEAQGLAELAREQFPSKVLFGRRDDSVVEHRRTALEMWLNKLVTWAPADLEVLRFLQDDDSWPTKSVVEAQDQDGGHGKTHSLEVSRAVELAVCMVNFYCAAAVETGEPALIRYYRHPEASHKEAGSGFLGGVFDISLISRLSFGRSGDSPAAQHERSPAGHSEPEPEPELEPGANFMYSMFGRFKASGADDSGSVAGSRDAEGAVATAGGSPEKPAAPGGEVLRTEENVELQGASHSIDDVEGAEDGGDHSRPLLPVKRLKVASYQMRTDDQGKEYTVYQVKCFPVDELATAPWVVSRRFSAFSDLREGLGSAIAKLPFPSRRMSMSLWGNTAPLTNTELDERRLELESWLISVLGMRRHDELVLQFLNGDHVEAPRPLLSLDTSGRVSPADSDSKEPGTLVGVYRCVRRTIVRESWESWSEKLGILEDGVEVKVLQERLNEEGVRRARFISTGVDLMGGWCSVRAADGSTILELTFRQ